jgi:hypothetical protein
MKRQFVLLAKVHIFLLLFAFVLNLGFLFQPNADYMPRNSVLHCLNFFLFKPELKDPLPNPFAVSQGIMSNHLER